MADKVIILKVDLSCSMCCRKMKKVLKRHQDEWNIKKVNWDDKNNQITLSGPFDPDVLIKKLCCRACKTIKGINIPDPPQPKPKELEKKPDDKPPPEKKPATPPPEKKAATPPPEKKPATPPPEKKPATPPPEKKPATPPPEKKPATPPPEKKPATPPPEPEKKPSPPPAPAPILPQYPTFHMTGQICFCGPCHEKQRSCNCDCSHGHRPCVCDPYGGAGYGYGWNYMPPPPVYGKPTCQFFCEEDPGSCTVM